MSTVNALIVTMHSPKSPAKHLRLLTLAGLSYLGIAVGASALTIPRGGIISGTTLNDFRLPGTQPNGLVDDLDLALSCGACHGNYDPEVAPFDLWSATMMAQSARDPMFYAALAIAEQDMNQSGEMCLRCHAPVAWLNGRSTPTDGSGLDPNLNDFDGVTCHVCHRMVDPVFDPASNPPEDAGILASLALPPTVDAHMGQYVIDPMDLRRGPFDLGPNFGFHTWAQSPFHRSSRMCATCHDVSNPAFELDAAGTGWVLTTNDQIHPTTAKDDMFPVERTFGEWSQSVFALTPIDTDGRFGGENPVVASCQDCHMPDANATACLPGLGEVRPDMPRHTFEGVNTWVVRAIRSIYPDFETNLTAQKVDDVIARNIAFLGKSADLSAFARDGELAVRVVNQSGHKLPTGYGEGRRIWVNVLFEDAAGNVIDERGGYDLATAELDTDSTTVYEAELGLDRYMSNQTGLPEGESFHFVLNNKVFKDNRIPARGFTNAGYESVGAPVVEHHYDDQQHWDDVLFDIPAGATNATVRLYHQTTSREYIEFLRDTNVTNTAGQEAYDLWDMFGQSEPILMASTSADLGQVDCSPPVPFGLGTLTSSGELPALSASGSSVSTGVDFQVTGGIPGQIAVLFSGAQTAAIPHIGGTRLITLPQRELTFMLDAAGSANISLPAVPPAGTRRTFQVFFRDPGATAGIGLSSGVLIDFCD